jgi:hypothetical protein
VADVAVHHQPLVVHLDEHGGGEPKERRVVGIDAHDV